MKMSVPTFVHAQVGDTIAGVNGDDVTGMQARDVVRKIVGTPNTLVEIQVQRGTSALVLRDVPSARLK